MPPPKIGSGTAPKTPTALAGKKKTKVCENSKSDFTIQRRGQQREHHKNNRVNKKKQQLCMVHYTFLYISFPFLHYYDVKMPNFAFYGERKQATTKFYFSF